MSQRGARGRFPIIFVGPFPPPVGGAAKVTDQVFRSVSRAHAPLVRLSTSVTTLAHTRSLRYHLSRVGGTIRILAILLRYSHRQRTLYLVPDGGLGLWYTALYALLGTLGRCRVVVHHHSCSYLDKRLRAMSLITRHLELKAVHVFLTDGMRESFSALYPVRRSHVVQNAAFTQPVDYDGSSSGKGRLRLGHLSNLCSEKGFHLVAKTFEALAPHSACELHVAGPIVEHGVQDRLDALTSSFPGRVFYEGALYGVAKQRFYASLDVFLFPTQFAQEAAPNVIYEAAAAGVPTLAIDRGRIPEIVAHLGGACCAEAATYPSFVEGWLAARSPRAEAKSSLRHQFSVLHRAAEGQLSELVEMCAGGRVDSARSTPTCETRISRR